MRKKIRYICLTILAFILILLGYNFYLDIPVQVLKTTYTNQHSKFVEVEGMQVHYQDVGSGMPVVLLHGTGASLHTWDEWTDRLQGDYRIIRLDLPAFGLTGPHPQNDYQITSYTRFLNHFLTQLAVDSCYLVGNSLGGNIAWLFAANHPNKVKKMLLIAPSGYPVKDYKVPSVFKLARTPVLNKIIQYITPKWFIRNNLNQVYFDKEKVSDELVERYHKLSLREGNRAAFIKRAKTEFVDYSSQIKSIQIPTLLLWGKEDRWISPSIGSQFNEILPNSKLVILDKIGHVPMEEAPNQSVAHAIQFFEN